MIREIAWLEGMMRWQAGRVVWLHPQRGTFAPTPADLARARRRLEQIERRAAVARLVVGDLPAWLEQQHAHLAAATLLAPLVAPDLPDLVAQVPTADPALIRRLADLLLAEALCSNPLPTSPAHALRACGRAAYGVLRQMNCNTWLPQTARALAALTLGAVYHTGQLPDRADADANVLAHPWLRRCFAWGRQHGLPDNPWLLVRFLAAPDGAELAQQYAQALQQARRFRPANELLYKLVTDGVPPTQIIALLEALTAAAPLGRHILVGKTWQTHKAPQQKGKKAGVLRPVDFSPGARRQAVAHLRDILHGYVAATADPAVIYLIRDFGLALLKLLPFCPALVETIRVVLRQGLELPTHQQQPYLALLVAQHRQIWDVGDMPDSSRDEKIAAWLNNRRESMVRPIWLILRATGDIATVHTAQELGIINPLAYQRLPPDYYPVVFEIVRSLGITERQDLITLCRILKRFATAGAARAALRPLVTAIQHAPDVFQASLLIHVLSEVRNTSHNLPDTLRQLTPYVAQLTRCSSIRASLYATWEPFVPDLLALDQAQPEHGVAWFAQMLACLHALPEDRLEDHTTWDATRLGLRLGVILADDMQQFTTLFRAALRHRFQQSQAELLTGVNLLKRFPGLHPPLRRLFPQQPQRCADLLARLGLASRLGVRALAPLRDLESDPAAFLAQHALPADWQLLLDEAPELLLQAGTYLEARHLSGAPPDLPGGVRKALAHPRKLRRETQHLEQLVARQPERNDLATRLDSLRERLADEPHLREQAYQEARARLHQVTAEAQLVAAEAQLLVCFRERLEEVIGRRVPADLALDDNLLNALLLSIDIRANRRLLRELLRAHVRGEHTWRERHPANATFLDRLAAQGVDVSIWLSDFPQSYRCPSATGGRVRLALERDPLHVLQMGNYFNTCLSTGGYNAFSTVANACDLNKRVLYARDTTGRVVGRTLIAITEAGELVRFHGYSALSDQPGNEYLRTIMRQYVVQFAAQCGLRLGEEGTVPLLCAQDWYDDGTVSWTEDAEIPAEPGAQSAQR
jgi:hypothetical protein